MKRIIFLGAALNAIRNFPETAKNTTGQQLRKVQYGQNPTNWKPMPSIGASVQEIRVTSADGIHRTIYTAKFEEAVYVLHAFQKKTQKTRKHDIELAKTRLRALEAQRK